MIKLRYDKETGLIGKAYNENLIVPEPYLLITEEENNKISEDHENVYFVVDGEFVKKNRAEMEEKARIAKLKMTPLDFIKCLEGLGVQYTQIKALCDANEAVDKELRFCSNVYRGNALLDQLCGQFGVTPAQLDEIFKQYGN